MIETMKDILENYLGVPTRDAGQGSLWSWKLNPPWPHEIPLALLGILAGLVFAVVALVYLRDARRASLKMRLGFIALRSMTILVLALILCGLTLFIDRTSLSVVAVMIDVSQSMKLDDLYPTREDRDAVKSILENSGLVSATRLNLARGILTKDDNEFLKKLLEKHKLQVYRFSETADLVGKGEYLSSDQLAELSQVLVKKLKPTGKRTNLKLSVESVLDHLSGIPLSAIVLFSDGISTEGPTEKLSEVSKTAQKKGVPLYIVSLGSQEPSLDIALHGLSFPEVAFVGDPIVFSADLECHGLKNRIVEVQLRNRDSKRVLQSKKIAVNSADLTEKIELVHTPETDGDFDFAIEAIPVAKESNVENNKLQAHVHIHREKLKVLLFDMIPRYEYRYLKNFLEREPTVELHTVLQDADLEFVEDDRTAIELKGRFPTQKKKLSEYDAIVFGDVDISRLHPSVLKNVRDFVRDDGGGLVFVAGMYHNPVDFKETQLEKLLPFLLETSPPDVSREGISDSFAVIVTPTGRRQGLLFRFSNDLNLNRNILETLPGIDWLFPTIKLQPAAQVLAEAVHDDRKSEKLPLIVSQRYGSGSVLFHASDDLWKWRFRTSDNYFGRYWLQALRFVSRAKLLGKSKNAVLETTKRVYQENEKMILRLKLLSPQIIPDFQPSVTVNVERGGMIVRSIELQRDTEIRSLFEGSFANLEQGSYHAQAILKNDEKESPRCDFVIESSGRELRNRRAETSDLLLAARLTGGKFYSISQSAILPSEIPKGKSVSLHRPHPIPIWNRFEILLLFAGLLTLEWLMRKRQQLI